MEETKTLIDDNNFMVIQGWMINKLKLKGSELLAYACIYGFSPTTGTEFTGSLQYLANWCCCTKRNVLIQLESLVEKGYIIKSETFKNGVKFCSYRVDKDIVENFTTGEKSSPPPVKKVHHPGEKSSPNNIDNISNNKNIYKEKYKKESSIPNDRIFGDFFKEICRDPNEKDTDEVF